MKRDPVMKLAVLPDYLEERWASMDLVAEMLLAGLAAHPDIAFERVLPPFARRATRIPILKSTRFSQNLDRLLNRMRDYPGYVQARRGDFDCFHVVDHSYSQLVHVLPANRTGVFCHDLDTFQCVLHPEREPRPKWFRNMASRILDGFRQAAVVFHTTDVVRQQIVEERLVDASRLVKAPLGVAAEFRPDSTPESLPAEIRQRLRAGPMLLHVGSCIPRKRIDVLLDVFARVRTKIAGAWLVQAGGEWSNDQIRQIQDLRIADGVVPAGRGLSRALIAELYRSAAIVLMPSSVEGFGLPVAEALACGAIVLASDIPVFREVGGDAVDYAPLADVEAWNDTIQKIIGAPERAPDRDVRLGRAKLFTWERHVATIAGAYRNLG